MPDAGSSVRAFAMRAHSKLLLAAVVGALSAPDLAAADPPDAPAFTLQVTPAYTPVPLRAWTSFGVEACAREPFAGTLALETESRRRRWDAGEVTLAAGACEVRRVPIALDEDRVVVVLRDARDEVVSRKVWSGPTTTTAVVLVLGPELLGEARAEAVQVAVASPAGGRLPEDPLLLRGVGAVLAPAERLDALDPAGRHALDRWVELGGILVRVGGEGPSSRAPTGLGRVDRLAADDGELRARLANLFDEVRRRWNGVSRPGVLESVVLFQTERPAWLDVSGHRIPPVWTIGLTLLAAVLLLASLPSRLVRRRLGSLSPFAGAPVVGLAAFGAIVGLAFAEKGQEPRYGSVAIVEAGSATPRGSLQRIVGLLATDAGETVVRAREGALLTPLDDPTGPPLAHARSLVGGPGPMAVELPAALWQTIYLREDSVVELGGGVVLSRGRRLPDITVENHTRFVLSETVVLAGSEDDRVHLGALEPGARRTIPWVRPVARARLPRGWPWSSSGGGGPVGAPVLIARLDRRSVPALPGARAEREDVLLRVVGAP